MVKWLMCFILAVVSLAGGLALGGLFAYVAFHYALILIITAVLACIIGLTIVFHTPETKDV